MVVTGAHLELRRLAVDAFADGGLAPEVERRALDRRDLTGRNLGRVHGRGLVGVQRQPVAEHVADPTPDRLK